MVVNSREVSLLIVVRALHSRHPFRNSVHFDSNWAKQEDGSDITRLLSIWGRHGIRLLSRSRTDICSLVSGQRTSQIRTQT
ncbi:MAG: hypothetical protein CBC48_11975 [bacterium TMED88]|nr:MAG: hypothetical protein CBC48_11975 [bacterium TMED88]